jgi:phage baseplate assembly protein W
MFTTTRTLTVDDHEATVNNLKLLLASNRGEFLGDPYFGCLLKKMIYEQNNYIIRDLIVDEIYSTITTFMPQIKIARKNITVTSDSVDVFAHINCINLIDYQTDLFDIKLTNTEAS